MLIKNGTVYTGQSFEKLDILIENGKIVKLASVIEGTADIDAINLIISPGFIDLHVHLREPGYEYKETISTGTAAAAKGGFTTICAMPNTSPTPDNSQEVKAQLKRIQESAKVNVLLYGCITTAQNGQQLADIAEMAPYCIGFSDDGKGVQSSDMMQAAMREVAAEHSFIAAHCEVESLLEGGYVHKGPWAAKQGHKGIPSASEYMEVKRDIALAGQTGCRLHICHVSSKESLEAIKQGKQSGISVTSEATPHQIVLCDEDITSDDGRFKMNPPLREASDRDAILQALLDGTIDAIATDHAPHSKEEKSKGLAESNMGVVGLETAFAVLYTSLVKSGKIGIDKLLHLLTVGPAKVLKQTCELKEGARADLTVIDPDAAWVVTGEQFVSKGKSTPFEGMQVQGKIRATIVNGEIAYQEERC